VRGLSEVQRSSLEVSFAAGADGLQAQFPIRVTA
jgi:hypothetical protein